MKKDQKTKEIEVMKEDIAQILDNDDYNIKDIWIKFRLTKK